MNKVGSMAALSCADGTMSRIVEPYEKKINRGGGMTQSRRDDYLVRIIREIEYVEGIDARRTWIVTKDVAKVLMDL